MVDLLHVDGLRLVVYNNSQMHNGDAVLVAICSNTQKHMTENSVFLLICLQSSQNLLAQAIRHNY